MAVSLEHIEGFSSLPRYLTTLTGRERELALLVELIANPGHRLVTVVGPGGVGKTRLIVEALQRSILPIPLLFVDGAAIDSANGLMPALASQLELEQRADETAGSQVSELLAERPMLLVLDNLEHLTGAVLELAALLRACPGVRMLATSRTPLRISGERLFPLEPLQTGGMDGDWSPAARLLLDRAALANPALTPDTFDRATGEAICVQLDGLPLSIELAAARLRLLSPSALLALLTNQLAVLSGGPRDANARHRSVAAAIAWSVALLSEEVQHVFRQLGVFPDSFSLAAAQAVCLPQTPSAHQDLSILDRLASLHDQALLQPMLHVTDGEARFRMLVSVRELAHDQLRSAGALPDAQRRLASWIDALVTALAPQLVGPQQVAAFAMLATETASIRAVIDWSVQQRDSALGLRLIGGLWRFWANRGLMRDAREQIDRVFAGATIEPTREWGAALRGAAVIAELQTDWPQARAWGEAAIAIWDDLDEPAELARSWVDLGNISSSIGELDAARTAYERAVRYAEIAGDVRMITVARCSTGTVALRQGLPRMAAEAFDAAIPLMRTLEDQWLLAMTLSNYAIALCRMGENQRAIASLQECLVLRAELGDESGRAAALLNLEEAMGEAALGGPQTLEALEIAQRIGDPALLGTASTNLALRALRARDTQTAAARLLDALQCSRTAENPLYACETIELIAELAEPADPATAARLLGGVAAQRQAGSIEWEGQHAPRAKALDRRLERALGSEAYQANRMSGASLDLHALTVEAQLLAQRSTHLVDQPGDVAARQLELTARELAVLHLMVDGLSDREIGAELYISPKTANRHVANILAKLECRNRTAATAKALQLNLLAP